MSLLFLNQVNYKLKVALLAFSLLFSFFALYFELTIIHGIWGRGSNAQEGDPPQQAGTGLAFADHLPHGLFLLFFRT